MITVSSDTIENAIIEAAKQLNVNTSEICYEVVQENRRFPKRPAVIKAIINSEIETTEEQNIIPIPIITNHTSKANVPKCPTCNSTNIQRISTTKRMVSIGVFGLASGNIGKTMECKQCGYKW